MQIGDLVRIVRAGIGIPRGSVGLVIAQHERTGAQRIDKSSEIWNILLSDNNVHPHARGKKRRYLTIELEVISGEIS